MTATAAPQARINRLLEFAKLLPEQHDNVKNAVYLNNRVDCRLISGTDSFIGMSGECPTQLLVTVWL